MTAATGVSEFIAGLPTLVGCQLHTEATVTLFDRAGLLIAVGVLPDGVDPRTVIAGVIQARAEDQTGDQSLGGALITTHSPTATTLEHRLRAARLQGLLVGAGIDCPVAAWAVDAQLTWPVDDPEWAVPVTSTGRYGAELMLKYGPPAPDSEHAGFAYHSVSGALRDALADALPEVVAQERAHAATWGAALWRRATVSAAVNRLSDPQPLTGTEAGSLLLGLSDPRVRDLLIAHTVTVTPHAHLLGSTDAALAPDTGHLADLVRHAPPGLIAGPAALLSATLFAGGNPPVAVRAAALAALADDPGCGVAAVLGAASTERRGPVLETLAQVRPIGVVDQRPPAFSAGSDCWPDPLAGHPTPGFDPLAGPGDPLSGGGVGTDLGDWWGGLDDGPEIGR